MSFKNILLLILEIVFFTVSLVSKDFSWMVSFNLTILWYPIFSGIWLKITKNADLISGKKIFFPILFGISKLFLYILPFLLIFWGEKKISKDIFNSVASLIAISGYSWFLVLDLLAKKNN